VSAPRSFEEAPRTVVVDRTPSRRPLGVGWLRRRRNRRVPFARPSLAVLLAGGLRWLGRKLLVTGKVLVVVCVVALSLLAARQIVRHVIASPRFAVREIHVAATTHVAADEIQTLAGVDLGDPLLTVDPDRVATRLASHPWIASARVRRELPSVLTIDVTERRAAACALMGALYLIDEGGRPFKHATFEEADGLPVITGVTREQYAALRPASEAVFREALALLDAYGRGKRPKLSEVRVDPRSGFSLVLLDGAGEIRLGRGGSDEKLARLDQILAALGGRGPEALATIYLDGAQADRVTVRLASNTPDPTPAPATKGQKFRPGAKRGED
jgi:cell division protein FtsQ